MSIRHRTLPLLGFGLIAAAASPIGADTLGFHLRALKREFAGWEYAMKTWFSTGCLWTGSAAWRRSPA
ncbi:hypothetical protein [Methylohalobius crimeensis]|uniref:hypothetical protein n=1 Tax=Methylohalobius crimeensis TaxID=244365 RepID=UPI0003B6D26D|nr:hypothetical protein [Methylohalobius crimeensis]